MADSLNGYTCDFDVCIGRHAGHEVSANGLGYDVVMKLVAPLVNQGDRLSPIPTPEPNVNYHTNEIRPRPRLALYNL